MVGVSEADSRSRRHGGMILNCLILDTTFLIDAERSNTDLDNVIEDVDVAIAAITVAELQVGVELATGKTRRSRLELLDEIVASIPVLDYDLGVARAHAQLLVMVRRRSALEVRMTSSSRPLLFRQTDRSSLPIRRPSSTYLAFSQSRRGEVSFARFSKAPMDGATLRGKRRPPAVPTCRQPMVARRREARSTPSTWHPEPAGLA